MNSSFSVSLLAEDASNCRNKAGKSSKPLTDDFSTKEKAQKEPGITHYLTK